MVLLSPLLPTIDKVLISALAAGGHWQETFDLSRFLALFDSVSEYLLGWVAASGGSEN